MNWLKVYLEEFNGMEAIECDVENLYKQVNKYTLASHLLWTMWALVQIEFSLIDYDFCK
jgi:ethanolamine kinase